MKPVVNELEQQYAGRIDFRAIDIDELANEKIGRKYRVSGVPTYVFLDGNEELIFSRSGLRSKERMTEDLDKLLTP
jgi:thioredoxin-like negative regulator of GroEL